MIALPPFKIRCSKIGAIMTEPRSKGAGLSETCKTYLKEWVTEQMYGNRKEFSNKYTRKGNSVEERGIEFASSVLGWGMVFKNTERKSNEWCEGEADVVTRNFIADHKASWDEFTFPLFAQECPEKDYFAQLEGYMWLYDRPKAQLVYTLQDAPPEEVERIAWAKCRELGLTELDLDVYEQTLARYTFSHYPDYLRIKVFEFDRDQDYIDRVKARVEECREYITGELIPQIEEQQRKFSFKTIAA